jgi:hypothetical protein
LIDAIYILNDWYRSYYYYYLFRITANQGFYLLGLYHLSPTYASAIQNTVPAITFVMAAVLRWCQQQLACLSAPAPTPIARLFISVLQRLLFTEEEGGECPFALVIK